MCIRDSTIDVRGIRVTVDINLNRRIHSDNAKAANNLRMIADPVSYTHLH